VTNRQGSIHTLHVGLLQHVLDLTSEEASRREADKGGVQQLPPTPPTPTIPRSRTR
jgi:hypothetical protein